MCLYSKPQLLRKTKKICLLVTPRQPKSKMTAMEIRPMKMPTYCMNLPCAELTKVGRAGEESEGYLVATRL